MKKNSGGFITFFVLIIVALLGTVFISVLGLLSVAGEDASFLNIEKNAFLTMRNNAELIQKIAHKNNEKATIIDSMECSGKLVFDEDKVTCPSGPGEPPIIVEYKTDNNDYKCDFTNNYNIVDPTSTKKCDDDDLHRRKIMGVLSPGEIKTIFFMNDISKKMILENPNNIGDNVKIALPSGIISVSAYFDTIEENLQMAFHEIDKQTFNETKVIKIKNTFSDFAGIASMLLDTDTNDYAFNVKNTGLLPVYYEITAKNDIGEETYIVPVDDSDSKKIKILEGSYINLSNEMVYVGKEYNFFKK